jgi:hypothetical protein
MRRIFELEPDEYMVSDESYLSDVSEGGHSTDKVLDKVRAAYGPEVASLGNTSLLAIFRRIRDARAEGKRMEIIH